MLIALILSILMLTGLYFSPKVRTLTDKKPLQSVYHICAILFILFGPIMILPALGVPVYVASLAGKFLVFLGIPLLIFVGIKKIKARSKTRQTTATSS